MTENSHGGPPLSYNTFRARVVQIHDEFLYANASAYFGEEAMWDLTSQRLHFKNGDLYGDSEGNIVLINNDTGAVDITGIGYAIGHYARWVKPGAVRVEGLPGCYTAIKVNGNFKIASVLGINVDTLRDVAAHGNGLVADGGCRSPRGPLVDVDDGDARALARERLGNALAKTRSGTGHQRNLVVETHVASFRARRIQNGAAAWG